MNRDRHCIRTRAQATFASVGARLLRPGAHQGQAAVEFTLIAIVTVIVIIATVNLFLISLAWLNAQFAAREGARASVTMVPFDTATIQQIVDDHFFLSDCFYSGFGSACSEGCCVQVGCCLSPDQVPCFPTVDCTALDSYDPVTVRVRYQVQIFPFLREVLGESIQVVGSVTMRQARRAE